MIRFSTIRAVLSGMALFLVSQLTAQSSRIIYDDEIERHRREYKADFTNHQRSPVSASDTGLINFFLPDISWRIKAKFKLTPDAKPFQFPSFSGKSNAYRQYGTLELENGDSSFALSIYQNVAFLNDSTYKNYLFLPFTDLSNGETTYEGGRYLDFSTSDISDGVLVVDFNKCYNPYCAYSDGYSCPVPPVENRLKIEIPAGEKKFGGAKKH